MFWAAYGKRCLFWLAGFASLKGPRQSKILINWTCRRFWIILGADGTRYSCIWRRYVAFLFVDIKLLVRKVKY